MQLGGWRADIVAVCAVVALFILLAVDFRNVLANLKQRDLPPYRQPLPIHMRISRQHLLWCCGLLLCGASYGLVRGAVTPVVIPHVVFGLPCNVIGIVQRITPSGRNVYVNLLATTLTFDRNHTIHGEINVDATVRRTAAKAGGSLQVGDRVMLAGFFEQSQQTSVQQTVLQWLNQSESFSGRVAYVQSPPANHWMVWRAQINHFVVVAAKGVPAANVRLLESIVFGSTDVGPQNKQMFLNAGLMHILAASGANIMLFEIVVRYTLIPLCRILRCPRLVQALCLIACTWWFAGICSFGPSILRATWMATFQYVGQYFHRSTSTGTRIGLAAVTMALIAPAELWSASAWLSFTATMGIARAATARAGTHQVPERAAKWQRMTLRLLNYGLDLGRFTLYVELYTTPLTIALFGQWSIYAILSNIVAEPVLWLLMPLCAAFVALSALQQLAPILTVLLSMLSFFVFRLLQTFLVFVSWVAHLPHALVLITAPPLPILWLGTYYGLLLAAPSIGRLMRRVWSERRLLSEADGDIG